MKKFQVFTSPVLLLASAIVLSGCAHAVAHQEKLLAKAGFQAQPADTPERQALLANLPSHQFVRSVHGSQITYTYADPMICHCLYIGSDWAYNNYRRLAWTASPSGTGAGFGTAGGSFNNRIVAGPLANN